MFTLSAIVLAVNVALPVAGVRDGMFGALSVGMAAVFLVKQSDYKRLLAYSSVENIGLVSLGLGLGGFGAYGGLLHALLDHR